MEQLKRAENAPQYLNPLDYKQPLMLDMGAGGYSSDDKFTSVDLYTECDIQASMENIPLPDGCVEAIFSSNSLEHVGKRQIVPILKEWHRLLKPEGKLQVIVPDLEWACYWWLDHQEDRGWSLDILFGHQLHDGEYHKTGFTPRILWDYFQEAGGFEVHKIEYILGEIGMVNPPEGGEPFIKDVSQRCIVLEASKTASLNAAIA